MTNLTDTDVALGAVTECPFCGADGTATPCELCGTCGVIGFDNRTNPPTPIECFDCEGLGYVVECPECEYMEEILDELD